MKQFLTSVLWLSLAGCIDLAGSNTAFCLQRPDVCGEDGGPDGGGERDSGVDAGADGGEGDSGVDAGVDGGTTDLLRCDAAGLVAWWTFDEDAGPQLSDCSPRQLHAQVVGTPFRVAGKHGLAFSFTGMNSAEVGNPPALRLSGAMSVSAWLRITSFAGSGRLISKSGSAVGWELRSDSAQNRLAFTVAQSVTTNFTVGASVPTGQWVHVAATFVPGGALSLYVDGVLAASRPGPATGFDTDAGVGMGTAFYGLVDDLRVFDRALGAAEVSELAR